MDVAWCGKDRSAQSHRRERLGQRFPARRAVRHSAFGAFTASEPTGRPARPPEADLVEVYETERHLLYVAFTRPRDSLWVFGVAPEPEFLRDVLA